VTRKKQEIDFTSPEKETKPNGGRGNKKNREVGGGKSHRGIRNFVTNLDCGKETKALTRTVGS